MLEEGNPFGASAPVTATGVTPGGPAGGYTIIDAASLQDATDKAQGCPVLATGGSVEVYETRCRNVFRVSRSRAEFG